MKKQLVGIAAAALIVVSGCGAENEEGQQEGTTNQNIEPVRYQNHPDGLNHNRNYTLQRDLEEPERTDINTQNINNTNNRTNNGESDQNADQFDVANEAADLIEKKIDVIDNVYVITTDNNAYVAAELDTDNGERNNNNGDKLTDEVKEQIASIVKSVDHDIDNVYVSTNPDFMDLANNYSNDIDNGEPVEGFFEEFGNMIERIFPQNK
ncbi:YhcN/YlaJ family sporulation lipoprotein [Paucisalibacillus sp. EB02]|uniref:YhcN/YlaJ family sporulation lipoprotein n=1 Tax=Paucisalibacillus sp. EB02 TaxID=1347087 RepID=UPI0005A7A804|nr:YhcN/YlaJ family sporulation lipoprotein [Paucisalibacillus sp. EB02]